MYDIKWIRENPDAFDRGLKRRGLAPLSQHLISIDQRRLANLRVRETWQARRRVASEKIHQAISAKDTVTEQKLKAEVAECKTSISTLEVEEKVIIDELRKALVEIPNLPLDDVPDGAGPDQNVERTDHRWGQNAKFEDSDGKPFPPKQHFELGEALGMMNFELAAKLSGARFVVLQKGLARMERALGQLFLDVHTSEKHGYTEVSPPLLVNKDTMFGTAQLPKFAYDQFLATNVEDLEQWNTNVFEEMKIEPTLESIGKIKDALQIIYSGLFENRNWRWLIPTAEVPLTNLVRESIVEEKELPLRLTACTPCFRAEAGAAGKDTRGMIRQHQFTKVELVSITTPEQSRDEHERMLACAEEVLKQLDLHYRVVTLCTGDMGFAAQKTYDIEVWLPGQGAYREISSCSNCGEFQARRMNARYRCKDGVRHVHTLNGSGVAVGRALIAVMETYQDDKGAIVVPEALKPYMGGMSKIERA
jgi:seryl-tRNA synthetase